MNKADLVGAIASRTQKTRKESEEFLNAFIAEVSRALVDAEEVKLIGFGTFKTSSRKARSGRNPRTGVPMTVPPMVVPVFRPGKELKDRVR